MNKTLVLVIVLVAFLGAGCSSTSTKVISEDTYKGELIDVEKLPREVEREDTAFSLDAEKVMLIRTTRYATPQVATYQRMREIRYQDTTKSPRPVFFLAPLCPHSVLLLYIFGLDDMGLGECFYEISVNEAISTRTEEKPVEDDPVIEKRTSRESERKALTGAEVPLLLNGQVVQTLEINDKGYAYYDLLALIEENNIHPRDLVHGESLRLLARYQRHRSSYQLSARSIPEAYFEAQYQKRRQELVSTNKARHDNCRTIAVDYREFFECYYQRNLM